MVATRRSLLTAVCCVSLCVGCGSSSEPKVADSRTKPSDTTADSVESEAAARRDEARAARVPSEDQAAGPDAVREAIEAAQAVTPEADVSRQIAPPTRDVASPERGDPRAPAEPAPKVAEQERRTVPDASPPDDEPAPATRSAQEALESEELVGRYNQLLRRRPLHGPALEGLYKHYAELGQLKQLVGDYEQQVEALPDEPALRVVLARLYLRTGKAADAARLVDRLTVDETNPHRDDPKMLAFQAEVYQRAGRTAEAETVLARALEQTETISERLKLTEALADLHVRSGDREKAAAVLIALADEYPDNYFHRKRLADALRDRELHEHAAEQFRRLLPLVENETDKRCEVLRQLGRSLEQLGRRGDAIDAYSQAINLLSADHWMQRELQDRLVLLYRASGRLDDLVQYCRDQVARSPEQTPLRELLAEVLFTVGQPDEARAVLEEAVGLFPKDRPLSQKRIVLLERLDDADGAAAEYERIITEHPDDVELYVTYGQFLARHEQLEKARQQWKHVLGAVPDPLLAQRLAGLFEQYELYDDAVECYERSIALRPERGEAYAGLSRLWLYRGERDRAVATLRRMAEANPEDGAIHHELAQGLLGLAMLDEALEAITKACELEPEQFRYQLARADLLLRNGRLDESLAVHREVVDLMQNPQQQLRAIDVLASMHESAGKLDALEQAESERLAGDGAHPVSRLILARVADLQRDFASARGHLDALLEDDPAHEEGRRQLAKLLEALGDLDGAVEQYRRLVELNAARGRYYYQAIADLRLRYNDKAGAVETFDEMVQASPNNATVLSSVAEQLVRLDELNKAIDYYEQSLRIQPANAESRLNYAEALHKAGRLEDAMAEFKQTALQTADRDSALAALNKLHETAGQLGKLDELLAELETRVETNPDDTAVARMLAELFIREFEYSRATDLLDLLVKQHPRDVDVLLVRAELLRRLTRFDAALEEYRGLLRFPNLDRDYVLGALGRTYFESGQLDEARETWRRINNKLYAGTLLRNNGLVADAIEVFQEGIRLRPHDFALHRNLVQAYERAGDVDQALSAARRLLDLEPDNVLNIKSLARAYIKRGDRAGAASVAARLFSAGVGSKQPYTAASNPYSYTGMPLWAQSMMQSYGYGMTSARNNLEQAVAFFREIGLMAELEQVLDEQLRAQPDNALLKLTAARLFSEEMARPEAALTLLRELESAEFPLEHRSWLGQSSQEDYFRIMQYQLVGQKPALRDQRLAVLEAKPADQLDRNEGLELGIIRQAQGARDKAVDLFRLAADADGDDLVALSLLVDTLTRGESFEDAEPYAVTLVQLLARQRDAMREEIIERVRRDFVRTLPIQLQLRVTDELLADVADKWTLGQAFVTDLTGFAQILGLYRAKLTLATIYAETDRMDQARQLWRELEPGNPADAQGWTMLAAVAQLHDQQDLAFEYYEHALESAKVLAGDPLLSRIYGGSMNAAWFGEAEGIDSSFNKIVEAFATRDKLVELYDFLRDTDQFAKARRVREQYDLTDRLITAQSERVEAARERFGRSEGDPLDRSVPYFMEVSKLAELYDQSGNWSEAARVYERYLEDFPDELGLLVTLSEVAEAMADYPKALEWEMKVVEAKERLARKARQWNQRELYITPSAPQALAEQVDAWSWSTRWGKNYYWWYGGQQNVLGLWPSWMRIAQLYLAEDNVIAASDALQRAIRAAGNERSSASERILALLQRRGLTARMLPVVRSLAIYEPSDEPVQLAFARALEANGNKPVAAEVYRRMVRRGVSDIDVLAQIQGKLKDLDPEADRELQQTLASLERDVAADPQNARNLMRLAKAYYYSLQVERAHETLERVQEIAPHLEGLHDLFVEIYTLKGDSERLLEALRAQAARASDETQRARIQRRLVDELLALGRRDEAIDELKKLPNAQNPESYQLVGMMLEYFGRFDEAIEQYELAARSQGRNQWGDQQNDQAVVRVLALKGDLKRAAEKIVEAIDNQNRQMSQYGGMYAAYGFFQNQSDPFAVYVPLFVLYEELVGEVESHLAARCEKNPQDLQANKTLMQFYRCTGRDEKAEAILEEVAARGLNDENVVSALIDRAVQRKQYQKAIELAEKWVAQQPKPQLPPGIPQQYAGMMSLMSSRNMMLCKLGDLYWKTGDQEKAFEKYKQLVDDKVDASQLVYATLCTLRGRTEEGRAIVEEALSKQKVKSPALLQFQAFLAMVDGDAEKGFDYLAEAAELGGAQQQGGFGMMDSDGEGGLATLAAVATQTGQIDRFKELLEKRIEKNPNDWQRHLLLANTLRGAGRIAEAFDALDAAAKVPTLKQHALGQRINWLEGHADAETLVPLYQELIEISEKKVQPGLMGRLGGLFGGSTASEEINTQPLRDRLGRLLWERGDRDEAEKVWTARMDRDAAETHLAMGQRFLELEDYGRAQTRFEKALQLQPHHTAAHRALAGLAFHRGDHATAISHMKEIFLEQFGGDDSSQQQYYQYRQYGGYYGQFGLGSGSPGDSNEQMRRWAVQIISTEAGLDAADTETRLMLVTLTGDWPRATSELGGLLESSPYDPMVWSLWAKAQQRDAQWDAAVQAWRQVLNITQTSIPDRRDQLKLVLADRQIRDAAAGVRTASTAPPAAAAAAAAQAAPHVMMGSMQYSVGWNEQISSIVQKLAPLLIKLERYDEAEMAYLRGQSDFRYSVLPTLMHLMYRQGAKERAVQLARLSMTQSQDINQIPQLAAQLAALGKMHEAVDLLIRAYRLHQSQDQSSSSMSMMYGGYYPQSYGQEEGWQDNTQSTISNALFRVLSRNDKVDEVLDRLSEDLEKNRNDIRTAKLLLALQLQAHRWPEARKTAAQLAKLPDHDAKLRSGLFQIHVQLEDWESALALCRQAQQEPSEQSLQWKLREAFVHLLADRSEEALEALSPLLDEPLPQSDQSSSLSMTALLLASGNRERLIEYLEKQQGRAPLDEANRRLLFRLYQTQQRWNEAARLALDALEESPEPLSGSAWYPLLEQLGRAAKVAGVAIEPPGPTPEDVLLLQLAAGDTEEPLTAFGKLVAEQPDNLRARRGLVLAAQQAGQAELAAEANQALLDWLGPRRLQIWREPHRLPVTDRVAAYVQQLGEQSLESAAILGMSFSFSQQLAQLFGGGMGDGPAQPVPFEVLWKGHALLQRELLLRAGKAGAFEQLVKSQAQQAANMQDMSDYYDSYSWSGSMMPPYARYQYMNRYGARSGTFDADWREALEQGLARFAMIDRLVERFDALGSRIEADDWLLAAELFAAAGRDADARIWRQKWIDDRIAAMRAADGPTLAEDANQYSYWSWYGAGDQVAQQVRNQLQSFSLDPRDNEATPTGASTELSQLALVDPRVEERLLTLDAIVAKDWRDASSLRELVSYYQAKGEYQKVRELLDRAFDLEKLVVSHWLSNYLHACYRIQDYGRVEEVLAAVAQDRPSLENDVALERLILLRHQGKHAEADALEEQLLARCVVEPAQPWHIDAELLADAGGVTFGQVTRYSQFGGWTRSWSQIADLSSVSSLAQALGINFASKLRPEDLTVERLAGAYARHAHYEHAARFVDRLIEQADAAVVDGERNADLATSKRVELLERKAHYVFKAGSEQQARPLFEEVEAHYRRLADEKPSDPESFYKLATLYASKSFGENYEKAYEALMQANVPPSRGAPWRRGSPTPGKDMRIAGYLYKLGRYVESWETFAQARRRGEFGVSPSTEILFQAGIAAHASGDEQAAAPLLRQALWRNPRHALAEKARELIDE